MAVSEKSRQRLLLTLKPGLISNLFYLLQHGFILDVQVGCSIESLLCTQLGMNPAYLEDRIQTIFLNGKPVDDVNRAIVKEGSTLALSAAIPGLVGAMLRKGGYYAPMRSEISYREDVKSPPLKDGTIVFKLFNLLTRELGPSFLEKGIWMKGQDLEDFIKKQRDDFWSGCIEARINGELINPGKLKKMKWANRSVHLRISVL